MNLSETADWPTDTKKRQRWPILVQNGSVVARIYKVTRKPKHGKPAYVAYGVSYHLPSGRKVDQRGTLEKAKEHARLVVDSIAEGELDAAEMSKHDRMELLALRERASAFGMKPLMALDEWAKGRELVGGEIVPACEAWKRRLTKFTRISVFDCVDKYEDSIVARNRARGPKNASRDELVKLLVPKSYRTVLSAFKTAFAERYLDDIKKAELDTWFASKGGGSGYTYNTYRKRVVSMFGWARRAEFLPRDMVTEADQSERAAEEAPKRELTSPDTLARILFLLQDGIDIENPEKKYDPRPELVPPVALSAFSGYRSIEGHKQTWEDIDLEEEQGAVTKAKRGTIADRATKLPACAIAWLKCTPEAERTGPVHAYSTEIHTIIRNHLKRTIGLTLPPNTLRKTWESYRYVVSNDEGAVAADEAGHTTAVAAKHYRNPRAKKSAAARWFDIYPDAISDYLPLTGSEHSIPLSKIARDAKKDPSLWERVLKSRPG